MQPYTPCSSTQQRGWLVYLSAYLDDRDALSLNEKQHHHHASNCLPLGPRRYVDRDWRRARNRPRWRGMCAISVGTHAPSSFILFLCVLPNIQCNACVTSPCPSLVSSQSMENKQKSGSRALPTFGDRRVCASRARAAVVDADRPARSGTLRPRVRQRRQLVRAEPSRTC